MSQDRPTQVQEPEISFGGQTEREAELAGAVPELSMLGVRPIYLRPVDDPQVALSRVRRVRGIKEARLLEPGEGPDDWPPDEEGGSLAGADGGVLIWIACVGPVIGLTWLLWSLFKSEEVFLEQLDGRWLSDNDRIQATVEPGQQGYFNLTLSSEVDWWKDIEVRDVNNVVRATAWTESTRRESKLAVPNSELRNLVLVFGKAKQFGVHALKYQMAAVDRFANKRLTIRWLADAK